MTEIRPIRAAEAETFLELLCSVFELDFNRAHGIFFNEPLFDLRRKWALFEESEMISILTCVPLAFGWGNAIGIAGVATKRDRQRQGHAGRLLLRVLQESERAGETGALLFAKATKLYERVGFEEIDQVIRSPIDTVPEVTVPDILDFDQISARYTAWSEAHPDRLRRDSQRWSYWKWNMRVCTPLGGGYVCSEGTSVRECILDTPVPRWPMPGDAEWLGLSFMARQFRIPLRTPTVELHLMGRNIPGNPQMFMTDQF